MTGQSVRSIWDEIKTNRKQMPHTRKEKFPSCLTVHGNRSSEIKKDNFTIVALCKIQNVS